MGEAPDVVVVGAGLAGLACAVTLNDAGKRVCILESADAVGGRVRTDLFKHRSGIYRLDRGFQVLLTAYPEVERFLDLSTLNVRALYAGADVRFQNEWHRVANPWKHPIDAAKGFLSPVATLADKARIGELYASNRLSSLQTIAERPETATIQRLRAAGFAETTIDRFFRAFFGGVFFDRELATSSRFFDFIFRMFSTGDTVIPSNGMQAIPEQLLSRLPENSVRLNTSVLHFSERADDVEIRTVAGDLVRSHAVVVATESSAAQKLLDASGLASAPIFTRWSSTVTLHYATNGPPPIHEPVLLLNGDGASPERPVNHVAFPSLVCPAYAPANDGLADRKSVV